MAKRKTKTKRKRKTAVGRAAKGQGQYCVMTRKPRGDGWVSQTTCYRTMDRADKAYLDRKSGSKSIMVYRRVGDDLS